MLKCPPVAWMHEWKICGVSELTQHLTKVWQ